MVQGKGELGGEPGVQKRHRGSGASGRDHSHRPLQPSGLEGAVEAVEVPRRTDTPASPSKQEADAVLPGPQKQVGLSC